MTERRWRWIAVALVAVGAVAFLSGWGLHMKYASTLPKSPDPAAGRVIALNSQGSFAYMTRKENRTLDGLLFGGQGLFWAGALLFEFKVRRGARERGSVAVPPSNSVG